MKDENLEKQGGQEFGKKEYFGLLAVALVLVILMAATAGYQVGADLADRDNNWAVREH